MWLYETMHFDFLITNKFAKMRPKIQIINVVLKYISSFEYVRENKRFGGFFLFWGVAKIGQDTYLQK
jgi:hypothetical protein